VCGDAEVDKNATLQGKCHTDTRLTLDGRGGRHRAMAYRPLWWMPVATYAGKKCDARGAMENGDGGDEVGREATKTKAREMFARWLRDAKGARLPAFLTARG